MNNFQIYNYVKAKQGSSSEDSVTLDALITRNITQITNNRVVIIENNAFRGCTNLAEVNFSNAESIGGSAFYGCTSLISLDLPNVVDLSSNAFYGCTNLARANFPNVVSIGGNVFYSCRNLSALILCKNYIADLLNANTFTGTPIAGGTGYIYVPDNLVSGYKTATNWTVYEDQIKGLSQLPGEV